MAILPGTGFSWYSSAAWRSSSRFSALVGLGAACEEEVDMCFDRKGEKDPQTGQPKKNSRNRKQAGNAVFP